jgi:hypothetical protein
MWMLLLLLLPVMVVISREIPPNHRHTLHASIDCRIYQQKQLETSPLDRSIEMIEDFLQNFVMHPEIWYLEEEGEKRSCLYLFVNNNQFVP